MRPGRPDFPPLEQPSGRRARRLRLNCSEIRSRLRLAHPHADITFASGNRSEEHTSELQSLMRISYAVFCLKKKKKTHSKKTIIHYTNEKNDNTKNTR